MSTRLYEPASYMRHLHLDTVGMAELVADTENIAVSDEPDPHRTNDHAPRPHGVNSSNQRTLTWRFLR
jgi:hypothetical protein